jgi:hypothetical protein
MVEKAENIKRIMSPYLRMVGGRLKWLANVLHIRSEDDSAYQNISAGNADLDSVSLKDPTRSNTVKIQPDAATNSYDITLPPSVPNNGDVLEAVGPAGVMQWSAKLKNLGTPYMDEINMSYGQVTYPLTFAPNGNPVEAYVNGIQVEFTILANTITITTYSAGDIENTDTLRVFYYY